MTVIEKRTSELQLQSAKTFEVVVQHWAMTQMDGPIQLMARFDDAARQLIVVGGGMQTVFFAVLALSDLKTRIPLIVVAVVLGPLLALVFCAAKVICTLPTRMAASDTYKLALQIGQHDGLPEPELTAAINSWCIDVDKVVHRKHRWLFSANIAFWLSSLSAATTLLLLMRM